MADLRQWLEYQATCQQGHWQGTSDEKPNRATGFWSMAEDEDNGSVFIPNIRKQISRLYPYRG